MPSAPWTLLQNSQSGHRTGDRHLAEGDEADLDHAVVAARRAFEGALEQDTHGHILYRPVELKQHSDEIAARESRDAGEPISGVLREDLPAVIDTVTYYAGWLRRDRKFHRSEAVRMNLNVQVGRD
nr:aldehyde dehydrogenase family protein [Bradyrhizobium sp.]